MKPNFKDFERDLENLFEKYDLPFNYQKFRQFLAEKRKNYQGNSFYFSLSLADLVRFFDELGFKVRVNNPWEYLNDVIELFRKQFPKMKCQILKG
ncbi:MAG: hypothetical protein NZL96_03280 [Patescibacteria group bacterium]|nr:hypothetical protein [Patescibacteria group bacterium]